MDNIAEYSIYHWQPWVYASLSILVLSLVGLLGILLVPIVDRVLYNHLLQFLVAMAAGSLAGDALMHLLPEALGLHTHSHVPHHDHAHTDNHTGDVHDSHDTAAHAAKLSAIWKCCTCFAGIYAFFLIEQSMGVFREYRRRREEAVVSPTKAKRNRHLQSNCQHTHVMGFKLSGTTANQCVTSCDAVAEQNGTTSSLDEMAMQPMLLEVKPEPNNANNHAENHSHHSHHSHASKTLPKSIASVAWMVILGDGIHNFIDGLSVGVAYRTVSGGLSTSLAVLLHEIPHELGDFAVLLKAGMSVKLAVFYNIVSSVISFVGMIIGVILGQSHNTTGSWIFALAAGGFLHIALVDLLPELRPVEARKDESPLWHLLLQNLGLLTGVGIMVVIAVFESDIEAAFGASKH